MKIIVLYLIIINEDDRIINENNSFIPYNKQMKIIVLYLIMFMEMGMEMESKSLWQLIRVIVWHIYAMLSCVLPFYACCAVLCYVMLYHVVLCVACKSPKTHWLICLISKLPGDSRQIPAVDTVETESFRQKQNLACNY